MHHLQNEIIRLQMKMTMNGYTLEETNYLINKIEEEVRISSYDLLNEALQKVKTQGASSDTFVEEVTAVRNGDSYRITTDSGRTDFSIPSFPMLPNLLKNAKVAKDGSRYKVIPIAEKSSVKSDSIFDRPKQSVSGNVNYKTASSKQDANTQWVHPGKDLDMEYLLENTNVELDRDIMQSISDIISKYERSI